MLQQLEIAEEEYSDINKLLQTRRCDLLIRFDGAYQSKSKKRAGAGAVLYVVLNNVKREIWSSYCPVVNGENSGHVAEYTALILGLDFISSIKTYRVIILLPSRGTPN